MQEFNKLLVIFMWAVVCGLILLAAILGLAAWRAHRNAQLPPRQLIGVLLGLLVFLIVPALLLILYFPRAF